MNENKRRSTLLRSKLTRGYSLLNQNKASLADDTDSLFLPSHSLSAHRPQSNPYTLSNTSLLAFPSTRHTPSFASTSHLSSAHILPSPSNRNLVGIPPSSFTSSDREPEVEHECAILCNCALGLAANELVRNDASHGTSLPSREDQKLKKALSIKVKSTRVQSPSNSIAEEIKYFCGFQGCENHYGKQTERLEHREICKFQPISKDIRSPTPCPHHGNGCKYIFNGDDDLDSHMRSCEYRDVNVAGGSTEGNGERKNRKEKKRKNTEFSDSNYESNGDVEESIGMEAVKDPSIGEAMHSSVVEEAMHLPQRRQLWSVNNTLIASTLINPTPSLPSNPIAVPINKSLGSGTSSNKSGFIGAYSLEARRKRIAKFHEKRQARIWTKVVKYDVRKNFADKRVRVKGRFVKKGNEELIGELSKRFPWFLRELSKQFPYVKFMPLFSNTFLINRPTERILKRLNDTT
jgi:hypothetical protein